MSAFLLLLVCPLLGAVFSHMRWMPEQAHQGINAWVLRVAFPALLLERIPTLAWNSQLVFTAATPWLVLLGAVVLFPLLGRWVGWQRRSVGALVMCCGFGNTAFVGIPMILALAGQDALGPAMIADQLGSFLALSTAGVLLASIYAGDRVHLREIALRILRFPPFVALVAALAVRMLGGWPDMISEVLHRIGSTLTPLALFSVGFAFRFGALRGRLGLLGAGLAWKLMLAPLTALALATSVGIGGLPMVAGVMQAAQGPMITAGLIAQEHRLDPDLVTLMLGIGILLGFVSAPLWFLLIR